MNHYRYRTTLGPEGVKLVLEEFFVVRETECFYWVAPLRWSGMDQQWLEQNARKIRKGALVSHCYPDKSAALRSFKQRQAHRIRHAKSSLSQAELALAAIGEREQVPDKLNCGQDAYTSNLLWVEW